ncbi:MAG: hypothetical protein QXD13_02375 [Candidatus Pacearchaeota archaeon]
MKMKNKRAALEMSMGTIIILVLGVSMLILGMVLVRNIMCSAIGLTGDINDKVKGELNKLFGAEGGEVQCIGSGGSAVKALAGETNNIYCSFKAPETSTYTISVSTVSSDTKSLASETIRNWLIEPAVFSEQISPNDQTPKKVIRIKVPDTAPDATIYITLSIKRGAEIVSTQAIDLKITRQGIISGAIC